MTQAGAGLGHHGDGLGQVFATADCLDRSWFLL
jgi:hypothetical protein